VVFLGIVNFSSVSVNDRIGDKSGFAGNCAFDVGSGHGAFLAQAVGDDGNSLSMKKVEQAVIDRAQAHTQLIDAVAQIIGFRSAQLVAKKRQTGNGSPAFVVGFVISRILFSEPLDDRRNAFLFLLKDDMDRGHRRSR
jgi:hypothetical protein